MNDLIQNGLVIERAAVMSSAAGSDFVAYLRAGWHVPESNTSIQVSTGESLAEYPHRRNPLGSGGNTRTPQKVAKRWGRLDANGIGAIDNEHVFCIELIGERPSAKQGVSTNRRKCGIVLNQVVLELGVPILRELCIINKNVQLSLGNLQKTGECLRDRFSLGAKDGGNNDLSACHIRR